MCIFVSVNCLLIFLACYFFPPYILETYIVVILTLTDISCKYFSHLSFYIFNVIRFISLSPQLLQYLESRLGRFSYLRLWSILWLFSSYTSMILVFTFKSLDYLEFPGICYEEWIEFFLFLHGYPVVPPPLLPTYFRFYLYTKFPYTIRFISVFFILFFWSVCLFVHQWHTILIIESYVFVSNTPFYFCFFSFSKLTL